MVERFDFDKFQGVVSQDGYPGIGDYVLHSDYAALLQSHARLLEALKDARQTAKFEKHPFRGWHLDADRAIAAAQPFTEENTR